MLFRNHEKFITQNSIHNDVPDHSLINFQLHHKIIILLLNALPLVHTPKVQKHIFSFDFYYTQILSRYFFPDSKILFCCALG